jgi:mediator of RNA polymerase II transcription subunit 6
MPDAENPARVPLVGSQTGNTASTFQDTRTLAESLNLFLRYEDEYMDETPLVGEPGSFILSKAHDVDRTATATAKGPPNPIPTKMGTPLVRVETPGKGPEKVGTPSSSDESRLKKKKGRVGG